VLLKQFFNALLRKRHLRTVIHEPLQFGDSSEESALADSFRKNAQNLVCLRFNLLTVDADGPL
jgi:hypothetical protein